MALDKEILLVTGFYHLLCDRDLWAGLDTFDSTSAKVLRQKWSSSLASVIDAANVKKMSGVGALKGFKAVIFKERVSNFMTWIRSMVPGYDEERSTYFIRRVALGLVLSGFESLDQLCGLIPSDLKEIVDTPVANSVLHRLIIKVEEQHQTKYLVNLGKSSSSGSSSKMLTRESVNEKSAKEMAGFLTEDMVKFIEKRMAVECEEAGIPEFSTLKPNQCIGALKEAKSKGADVSSILEDKVTLIKLSSARNSLTSIASGLRCWDAFAVDLLGYPIGTTLPPRSDLDVISFISIFISGGTARNYVSYIDWGCRFLGLDLSWRSASVNQALKGAKKAEIRTFGGQARVKVLLTNRIIQELLVFADKMKISDGFQVCVIVCWEFLLRVKSEAIDIEVGTADEVRNGKLRDDRHSALWLSMAEEVVHLRLRRRKHRQGGSWLVRPCSCRAKRSYLEGAQFCVYHRVKQYLVETPRIPVNANLECTAPKSIFEFTASQFLTSIRKFLTLLDYDNAPNFTFKSFRAGKAQQLAKDGVSLGTILQSGEWRSAAYLRYVEVEALEINQAFQEVYHSDSELSGGQ
jgi:hypothetical protein